MSAGWGSCTADGESLKRSAKFTRIWGYLALAGTFLLFVYMHLNLSLF